MTAFNRTLAFVCIIAGCSGDDSSSPPEDTNVKTVDGKDLVRPGTVIQRDPRFGVPTFVWTRDQVSAPSRARWITPGVGLPAVAATRAVLADYAPLYGLKDSDIANAVVASVHDRQPGPILVKLRAQVRGIEIFGEELNVLLNNKLEGVAISGFLTSTATPPTSSFQRSQQDAVAAAVADLAKQPIVPSWIIPSTSRDGYDFFTLSPVAGITLEEQLRAKQVFFHLPSGLEAAYYIEVLAHTGGPPAHTLAGDDVPIATTEAYAYVISAVDAKILFRKNLSADAGPTSHDNELVGSGFTYRVWADPVTGIPSDSPAGDSVHPKVTSINDGAQATFVLPSDVTLTNFPFSRNDPWLLPGSTQTVGNNVDAYLNLFAPDGLGNPISTTPSDPPAGDFRAQITAADAFLHSQVPDVNGPLAEGRQGSIQQLFYVVNFLHDWYYDAGFDETVGNAQTDNFGRGGVGNDSIKAQVQDNTGFSNATMTTGADGVRPIMRMFTFPNLSNVLDVQTPASIGHRPIGISMSGSQTFDLNLDIVKATFTAGTCSVTNAPAVAGKLAMFDFDNTDGTGCSFNTRIARLQVTGATASLMVYTSAAPTVVANITGFVASNTKPIATISFNSGALIKAELTAGNPVTARLLRVADRDGALDNQIVAHEWFHYASNRLIGNGTGLNGTQGIGMGEGWGDFNSMMLSVRASDTETASNANFGGVYAMATYATSGVRQDGAANQGYYFGIRRYPYSTDMTKNPLTFRHISNGAVLPIGPPIAFGETGANNAEVHNTGEVWATMLWECYAGLLRDTLGTQPRLTFQQAQDRMKGYLIQSLKLTPTWPTFTEARDALLAVAAATDPLDYVAFRFAFAKRGAGSLAVAPDRFSTVNASVVEDFANGAELAFVTATLDDTLGDSCDADGVMDAGEYGRLTVTLRNTGTTTLSATTATISTTTAEVWFPYGPTVQFPPVAPGAITTVSMRIGYTSPIAGPQQVDLKIDYTDAQLTGGPLTKTVLFRTNTDDIVAATATDDVESATPVWTTSFATFGNIAPWLRTEVTPFSHHWHAADGNTASDQRLTSPVFTVDGSGNFGLQFDHSWSFEFDGGGNYDGGVVEASINGGAFVDLSVAAYNGTILNYSGDQNPLKGRQGFVKTSSTIHTSLAKAIAPGSTVQVRFRVGTDGGIGAPGWTIDNIAFSGVVETPFAVVIADGDTCDKVATDSDLSITIDDGVTIVTAGNVVTYTIKARNVGGDDIFGATVTAAFPNDLDCAWTCSATGGSCITASGTGPIQNFIDLAAGGTVGYTAVCTVSAATTSTSLSTTASIAVPGPVVDAVAGNNQATDVDTVIRLPAHVTATKTVAGNFTEGGTVVYTIVLRNDGQGPQLDNSGDELIDILPSGLTLVDISASSGVSTRSIPTNTATWNGAIPANGSATITITATINATAGAMVSNQATFHYDSDGDTTNDAAGSTEAFACP